MAISFVSTDKAPAAIGPYSQAVKAGPFLYASGQIPLRPDGTLVEGDIVDQAHQVFANIKAILAEAGLSLADVVKPAERRVRRILWRSQTGPFYGGSGSSAARRQGGNRSHCVRRRIMENRVE